jgi:XTP/dITP diphosphohydrolase
MKVVLATTNPGKLKELKELAAEETWLDLTMAPEGFNPKETGNTFVENARIKAREAARATGLPAVADDSGLVVEALNGKPGIHSARYCEGSDEDRRNKLLEEMTKIADDKRQAAFVCAMVVCDPDGTVAFSSIRYWEGKIALQPKGSNGFGYDPVFQPANRSCTAAELPAEEKNKISHRGQAWSQVVNFLKQHQSKVAQQQS